MSCPCSFSTVGVNLRNERTLLQKRTIPTPVILSGVTQGLAVMSLRFSLSLKDQRLGAEESSDPDADVDVDAGAIEQDEQEADVVEDPTAEVAEAAPAVGEEAHVMPAEISLERPGTKSPVTIPTSAMGEHSICTRGLYGHERCVGATHALAHEAVFAILLIFTSQRCDVAQCGT